MADPTDPKSPPESGKSDKFEYSNKDIIERINYIKKAGELEENLAKTALEKEIASLEKQKEIKKYLDLQQQFLDTKIQNNIKLNAQEEQILATIKKEKELLGEINDIEDERLEKTIKLRNKEKELGDSIGSSVTGMLGLNKGSSTLLGSMILLAGEGGNLGNALKQAGAKLAESLKPANVLASVVSGIVEQTKKLFFEMDTAFSQFEKTAGGVDAFKGRIEELRSSNVEYALSIGDAAKAYSDLKVGFAGFAGVSKTTQDQLAQTTATMSKLGVSSTETIKIQNMLVKGFQMTGQQAGDLQKQLMATAKAMGLPMQKVVGDFANASNGMRAHGSNMQKVFLDLQNQSKNLGIEFSKLQKITGQFDTFEGAADSAGKLNAILGGDYLNSLDLLNADEGERIRLMQEALQASNKSFEAMSKQERMAAAKALGLEDVTELQQLMNNEVEQGTVEALNKAQAEKELAQSVQDVTTMQEKLTAIMAQFAIVMIPVLDTIKSILTQIAEWMNKSEGFRNVVFGLIAAFAALFIILKGASIIGATIGGFRNLKETITGTKKPIEDAGSGFANAVEKVGKAAAGSAKGLLAFGAAALMIGGGIALAALGLAKLVMAFQGLTGNQILGALGALVIAMVGVIAVIAILGILMVSGVGAAAALGILALGAAFLMMGGAIYIASEGISTIIKAITPLAEIFVGAMLEGIKSVVEMVKTLASMNLANLMAMGPALLGIAGGLAAIAAVGVGAAISGLVTGAAGAIGSSLGLGSSAKNPLDMLVGLQSVIQSFPVSQLDTISTAIGKLIDSLSKSIGSDLVSNLKNIVSEINNIELTKVAALATISALNISDTPSVTASAASATVASSTNTAGSSSQTNLIPVAIYIDSKKVGEILDPRVKQTIQDSLKKINSRMVPV